MQGTNSAPCLVGELRKNWERGKERDSERERATPASDQVWLDAFGERAPPVTRAIGDWGVEESRGNSDMRQANIPFVCM
jgi:hypothetical protein